MRRQSSSIPNAAPGPGAGSEPLSPVSQGAARQTGEATACASGALAASSSSALGAERSSVAADATPCPAAPPAERERGALKAADSPGLNGIWRATGPDSRYAVVRSSSITSGTRADESQNLIGPGRVALPLRIVRPAGVGRAPGASAAARRAGPAPAASAASGGRRRGRARASVAPEGRRALRRRCLTLSYRSPALPRSLSSVHVTGAGYSRRVWSPGCSEIQSLLLREHSQACLADYGAAADFFIP